MPLLRDLMLPEDHPARASSTSLHDSEDGGRSSHTGHGRDQHQQQHHQAPMDASSQLAAQAMNVFESADVDEELAEVSLFHNGEEAISFFARNGANTPVKFVYCARRDALPGDSPFAQRHLPSGGGSGVYGDFRPYDLAVVPRKHVPREYYTVSASGSNQFECVIILFIMKSVEHTWY